MISSPCRNCSKKNMPKDICSKDCKKIQDIQEFQVSSKEEVNSYILDYNDGNRPGAGL